MYNYRDVLAHNGNLHKVRLNNRTLRFDDFSPIELPLTALMPRLGFASQLMAAMKFNDDTTHLVKANGTIIDLGDAVGNWNCAIGPTGEIFVQDHYIVKPDGNHETDLKVYDENGNLLRLHRTLYSSVGINYVDRNNVPVMALGLPRVDIHGVECLLPITDSNGNTIAQTDKFTNSGAVLFKANGQKLFYNRFIDRYPFVASVGNKVWSALQGEETPEPDDYSSWVSEDVDPIPVPGYNPKNDLIALRAELDAIINKL